MAASVCKISVAGHGSVGFLTLWKQREIPAFMPTYFDYTSMKFSLKNLEIDLHVKDISDSIVYDQLGHFCYLNNNIFILCYSLVSTSEYDAVKKNTSRHCTVLQRLEKEKLLHQEVTIKNIENELKEQNNHLYSLQRKIENLRDCSSQLRYSFSNSFNNDTWPCDVVVFCSGKQDALEPDHVHKMRRTFSDRRFDVLYSCYSEVTDEANDIYIQVEEIRAKINSKKQHLKKLLSMKSIQDLAREINAHTFFQLSVTTLDLPKIDMVFETCAQIYYDTFLETNQSNHTNRKIFRRLSSLVSSSIIDVNEVQFE
ncbi:hypothetical protein AKO1_007669 [Acrasis kona]|uniref:Uncharacterized protein n=1 Tax=Acrasis kona TaxID=1008807 RepID=A0AAW2YTD3_9EUKA